MATAGVLSNSPPVAPCRPTALVKAPFSWPNISLFSRVSGIAAQLIFTNGLSRLGLLPWMVLATSSLTNGLCATGYMSIY